VPKDVLEEDLQRERHPIELDLALEGVETVQVGKACSEGGPGAEGILAVRDSTLAVAG
jgi:hypothetical protein